jgi:hypothetical protein
MNAWNYASTPPYTIMVVFLFKHRDNFTFTVGKQNLNFHNPEKHGIVFMNFLSCFIFSYADEIQLCTGLQGSLVLT